MRAILIAALMLGLAACSPPAEQAKTAPPPTPAAEPPGESPVLGPFAGTLPCADCSGIRVLLTLIRKDAGSAEGSYTMTETYIGRGEPLLTKGEWTTLRGGDDEVIYQLDPDKPDTGRYFLKVDEQTIRALDGNMKPLPEGMPATLKVGG